VDVIEMRADSRHGRSLANSSRDETKAEPTGGEAETGVDQ
jgi:hypothetical protein